MRLAVLQEYALNHFNIRSALFSTASAFETKQGSVPGMSTEYESGGYSFDTRTSATGSALKYVRVSPMHSLPVPPAAHGG